ncbi:MAG TPA: radical SAM protein [Candidatus Norongarragalinales archaeon]|jgi:pyruvate-formate lyase-activating enzyme|nr:radical SAM protein [Candidatus Norongarragalinales archaeon]
MRLLYGSIIDREPSDGGRTETVIYLGGCPLRCGFCNTVPLVVDAEKNCANEDVEFFVKHLVKHQDEIDVAYIAGGEPFMQPSTVYLCKRLKHEGFLVKAETSGFYPEALMEALPYIDQITMDVKTTLKPEPYAEITGFKGDPTVLLSKVLRAIAFIQASTVKAEFKTTVLAGVNDNIDAIDDIARSVKFADQYTLQQFDASKPIINPALMENDLVVPHDKLIDLAMFAKRYIKNVKIRSADGKEEDVL